MVARLCQVLAFIPVDAPILTSAAGSIMVVLLRLCAAKLFLVALHGLMAL